MGLQFGKLSRLSGWASAAPIRSQKKPEPAAASSPHGRTQAPTLYSPDQTWLVSPCPSARTHALTHSLTRNRRRGSGGPQAGRAAGHARTTHQPGTLELNPNQAHHLAKPKPNPQGFVRDSGNVVHQLLSCSWPDPLSTTPSALHLSVPTTDDAGNLVCWIPGLRCMLKQA